MDSGWLHETFRILIAAVFASAAIGGSGATLASRVRARPQWVLMRAVSHSKRDG